MDEVGLNEIFLAEDLEDEIEDHDHSDFFMRCEWCFRKPEAVKKRLRKLFLHRAQNPSHMEARLIILAEALIPYKGDCWTSYPRDEHKYSDLKRYCGPDFKFDPILAEIDKLSSDRIGLLEHVRQAPGSHLLKNPQQSKFRSTQKLKELLGDLDLEFIYHDVIRKRAMFNAKTNNKASFKVTGQTYNSRLVRYTDTPETIRMRSEIWRINDFLRTIKLTWTTIALNRSSRYFHFDHNGVLTTPLFITRSFCRDSFDLYGRLHGFWQNQPKHLRADILLNGICSSRSGVGVVIGRGTAAFGQA